MITRTEAFQHMCREARHAGHLLASLTDEGRTQALEAMAEALQSYARDILKANVKDLEAARTKSLSDAFLDRLRLDEDRLEAIISGVRSVAGLNDPVGKEKDRWTRPNGLVISSIAVPIGVIGVIFESRPNVAADAAALCMRSGNGLILRSGSDAHETVTAIVKALQKGLETCDLPASLVQTMPDTDREWVEIMLSTAVDGVDLVIPRGGKSLVSLVRDKARVPTLSHLDGICHVYVHEGADPDMAVRIVHDSKMRRTGVCNAAETLLIDTACAADILPPIATALLESGCVLRGNDRACSLVKDMTPASEHDWDTEYLEAILSVAVVDDMNAALEHIRAHGSGHTETIITDNEDAASRFLSSLDSAVLLHNASTGFSDGGEFGFGGEIGISTDRLHARGPVGAEQLTSYKYVVRGQGQVRA